MAFNKEPFPKAVGPFTDAEALELLIAYRADPGALRCPCCQTETVQVLAFIEPAIDANGWATMTDPEGEYAVAVQCVSCNRAIGLLAGLN